MQAVRLSLRTATPPRLGVPLTFIRALSTPQSPSSSSSHSSSQAPTPWFVDDTEPLYATPRSLPSIVRPTPALSPLLPPLPPSIPDEIKTLHSALAYSPHLDLSSLLVSRPLPTPLGPPPLEDQLPKGRRKRGRTYVGEGVDAGTGLLDGGIWSWIVIAQVSAP